MLGNVILDGSTQPIPDIRKLDFLNWRMIVSRKRTRNLFNLTNLWKNIVLTNMEQQVLKDNHNLTNQVVDKDIDMDLGTDEDSDSSVEIDLFFQLLRNQGAVF